MAKEHWRGKDSALKECAGCHGLGYRYPHGAQKHERCPYCNGRGVVIVKIERPRR